MKLPHLFAPLAITVASIGGAQAVQAQNATLDAARNGDPIAREYVEGFVRLRDNHDLVLTYRDSPARLKAANVQGATPAQYAEEVAAKNKLDRAALPIIESFLNNVPASQLSSAMIDPVFELLGKYLTLRSRNINVLAANARAVGLQNEALAVLVVDDLTQGGSLAGFAQRAGTPLDKRDAILDHFTGQEAFRILMDAGYDIQLVSHSDRMKVDGHRHWVTFGKDLLIQPQEQQIGAYALRSFALRVAQTDRSIGRDSYLVSPVQGLYGNRLRAQRGVGRYDNAIDFSLGRARYEMGLRIAENLRNLPPEPAVTARPVANPTNRPAHTRPRR